MACYDDLYRITKQDFFHPNKVTLFPGSKIILGPNISIPHEILINMVLKNKNPKLLHTPQLLINAKAYKLKQNKNKNKNKQARICR